MKVKRYMKISELAKKSGVPPSTIRFYEEQGLLEPAGRRQNGYRYYTDSALRQLHIVRVCQSLGFSLETIRRFDIGGNCDHGLVLTHIALRTDAVEEERAGLDAQLKQLEALQEFLEHGSGHIEGCTLAD